MPKVVDGVERKTEEEIASLAKEAKGEYVKGKVGRPKTLKTEGAQPLESNVGAIKPIGDFNAEPAKQDAAMAGVFKKIEVRKDGWIKMSEEEVVRYQVEGRLIGHDPLLGIGLLRKD
jgi:hypothetical protein